MSGSWPAVAAQAADDKLGTDTVIIDVGDVLAITDYFVVTSGANRRQVRAIVEEVEEVVRASGGPDPVRVEGIDEYGWVLMDYGPFVVHVFEQSVREHYALERLWSDRPLVEWRTEHSGRAQSRIPRVSAPKTS